MSFQVRARSSVNTSTETIQSGRPQSLPPHEYLSFKNPDPYLLAIILNSSLYLHPSRQSMRHAMHT